MLPKSPIGWAISYALNHWTARTNYVLDGRIVDIINNWAECALRRVAVGRKNWMYIGIEDAGRPAVVFMSILQSCVEQDVNAVEYLRDVLARINKPGSWNHQPELTPAGWKKSRLAQERIAEKQLAIGQVVQSLVYASRAAGVRGPWDHRAAERGSGESGSPPGRRRDLVIGYAAGRDRAARCGVEACVGGMDSTRQLR